MCVPLKLAGFSGGSVQVSVKPQAAAIPAAVLTMHRYWGTEKSYKSGRQKIRLQSLSERKTSSNILSWSLKFLTSLGLLVPVCLPILCRLWERARRWDRCLYSPPSDWASWQGVAYAVQRQLYQETAGHGGGELIWRRERRSLAQMDPWNLTPYESTVCKEKPDDSDSPCLFCLQHN